MQWAYWCHTRKYFAPPVPQNILAQMQPRTRAPKEPDGPLDPDLAFLNMAVHGLADEEPAEAICFSLYYFHGIRPVKTIAGAMGIGTRTFYDRLHRFARRAHKLAATIKRVHLVNVQEPAEAVD
ncbi:hypothetical protein [Cupriavidus gilardii]|uniref:hypothetical protein n=1 Tax=Cupriavidus gilardii TaxID=82541 RepID=UPI0021BEDCAE|nr:hypothetical protein [Cupriavidus gilardii]MCT9125397.1 hypothetical protein [Cupriavidus gilardii]